MNYSTNRSYRDSIMIEVEKTIKKLDEQPKKKKSFWAACWNKFLDFLRRFNRLLKRAN